MPTLKSARVGVVACIAVGCILLRVRICCCAKRHLLLPNTNSELSFSCDTRCRCSAIFCVFAPWFASSDSSQSHHCICPVSGDACCTKCNEKHLPQIHSDCCSACDGRSDVNDAASCFPLNLYRAAICTATVSACTPPQFDAIYLSTHGSHH